MRDTLSNINNIKCLETSLYSDTMRIAGQVDCIAEYKGKLSVIDFKTSSKERKDTTMKTIIYKLVRIHICLKKELDKVAEQCVILVVTQDGTVQEFIKQRDDYIPLLNDAIEQWNKELE